MVEQTNKSGSTSPDTRATARFSGGDIVILALWFGLITGLVETGWLAYRKLVRLQVIRQPEEFLWMAPLTDACLFVLLGTLWALFTKMLPRLATVRATVSLLASVAFFCIGLNYTGIHMVAIAVLALGAGSQVGRLIARQPGLLFGLLWLTTGWATLWLKRKEQMADLGTSCSLERRQVLASSCAALAGLAGGFHGWRRLTEVRAVRALGPANREAPNVLLIVLDTVRAQSLSLHGYHRPTSPSLESLARRGVRFDRAYASSSWTLPSHATLFTGRHLHDVKVSAFRPLDKTYPTLAEVLAANGYETAGFAGNLFFCSREFGLHRGFHHYEDFRSTPGQIVQSTAVGRSVLVNRKYLDAFGYYQMPGRKSALQVNSDFLSWIHDRTDPGRPFFAFLNYFDAHAPYLPGEEFQKSFSDKFPLDPSVREHYHYPPAEIEELRDSYDRCVATLDRAIGSLFAELEAGRFLDNTLVIITSDHGEHFGEHGLVDHGNSLYVPLLHVPLLISHSGRLPSGMSIATPVSLRDTAATILDLLGLGKGHHLPGASLAHHWRHDGGGSDRPALPLLAEVGRAANFRPRWFPSAKGPMKCLIDGVLHYIQNGDGSEELYDVSADGEQIHNLASGRAGKLAIEQFRQKLRQLT